MPLYEYECRACGHFFEALIRGEAVPVCPSCNSADLQRCMSLFGVATESSRQSALGKARVDQRKANKDRVIAERERVENHHH